MPHVHIGIVEFITTACYVLIFTLIWRWLAARWADKPVGVGMLAVYS